MDETERARIAQELHDETGQGLIALKLNLEALRANLRSNPELLEIAQFHKQLTEMIALASQTIGQVARLVHHLHPKVLDSFSLAQVLEGVCEDFSKRTQRKVEYEDGEISDLPDYLAYTFYHFLQAVLTSLEQLPVFSKGRVILGQAGSWTSLRVEDGRDALNPGPFYVNLQGVEERIELFGGFVEKDFTVERGHRITAYLPFKIR